MKLSRKQIQEAAETLPPSAYLGKAVSDGLTPKQRRFAQEVAKGAASKAEAYRLAGYKAGPHTITREPYMLMRDPRIVKEIEAYSLAIESAKQRTPAHLRELVIQSLVQTLIDPEVKPATRIQAARVLGTVSEVAAFTERKEVRHVSSEDARRNVMEELRVMLRAGAEDAVEVQADELLRELAGETHPGGTPQDDDLIRPAHKHTNPLKSAEGNITPEASENITPSADPHPLDPADPPASSENKDAP